MKQTLKKRNPSLGLKILLFLLISGFTAFNAEAQQTVSGVVKDVDGIPLPSVTVLQKGTTRGTVTDFDGKYSLVLAPGEQVLVFSYLGFKTLEVPVSGKLTVDATLEIEAESLEEVVVVGYGTQKKESVVGAITQIKGEELMERTAGVFNVEQALQGNLPGVTAIQGSGTPGDADLKIFIRGLSSWNGTGGPLILVDGVKRSMTDIDMNDIENMSVLKDASATSVFGVEGANGVILITTKRGRVGKAEMSLSVQTTFKTASQLPEKLDSYDAFLEANSSILRGVAVAPNTWRNYTPLSIVDKYRNPASIEESYIFPNVDWEDELLKDFAQDYRVSFSVRGGNKKSKYFGSLNYISERDIFDGGRYDNGRGYLGEYRNDRFNFRSNIDFNITSTTELSINLAGYLKVRETPGAIGNVINGVYLIAPSLYTPKYPDGFYGNPFSYFNVYVNPIETLTGRGYDTFRTFNVTSDIYINQKLDFITKGLKLKANFSLDNTQTSRQQLNDGGIKYRIYDNVGNESFLIPNGVNEFDFVQNPWNLEESEVQNGSRARRMVYDVSLNYDTVFDENHNVSALFLFRRQRFARGSVFPRYREDWVGRVTYNYDLRYFLEVSGAYNGSEQFGDGFKFDLFPAVSLGWTPSNEAFLEDVSWINNLKVRGSIGVAGDDNFNTSLANADRFKYRSQWENGNAAFLNPQAYQGRSPYNFYRESVVGNPNLQWETAIKYNVGVDFTIFDGLLRGEIDYFAEDRTDIVVRGIDLSVPSFFGATPADLNTGEVEVRGYEVVLGSSYTFDNDLTIFGDVNFTQAIDKIISRDDPLFRPDYQRFAGYPIGQRRTAIPAGILTSWDDVYMSTPKNEEQGLTRVGYYDVVDFDGDGVYNGVFDNAPFGYPEQPQRNWSATIGTSYKGFTISAQFYGTQNATRRFSSPTFQNSTPLIFTQDLDYWTKETPNNIDTQPSFDVNGGTNPRDGDTWIDGSYTRLRAVSLKYNVPKETCEKIGLKKLEFTANGLNLFLWSDMPDDREFNSGTNARELGDSQLRGQYPTLRSFNFGFNMNF